MTKPIWRMLLGILAVFGVMAIAVACGDDDDDDTGAATNTAAPGASPTADAKPSGTITIRTIQFETWDPHFSDFNQDIEHFFMVWRGLYNLDAANLPQPAMADGKPTVSADGKTYTVKVQAGLKWSDGQPLDANDFVLGVQRTCNPDNAGHYQYILTAIVGCDAYYAAGKETPAKKDELLKAVGVRAVDATTIEFKLTDPQPTFPILLALWPTFPAPKHLLKTVDAAWPGPLQNVYNGPFKPSEYTEKDHMTMVPNPNYTQKEKAKIEKLVLRYIDDAAVALNAYRAGEIDATLVPSTQLDAVKKDAVLSKELVSYAAVRTTGLEPNLKDPLMAKLEVRLALSQATDRKTLNDVVLKGANIPSTTWMPPARSGTNPTAFDAAIGFDVAKAKENMKKAGYENGAGFPKLVLLQTDTATNKAIGEFLQAEWKKHLGITIELEYTDSKTRSSRFNSGQFQLVLGGWGEDYPDPENWILGLYETGGSINKQSCSMKAIDDLIAKAKYNTNDEQRRQQYRDVEKLVVENICGQGPMWQVGFHAVVKPHIKGMIENKKPDDKQIPGDLYVELWTTSKK
ncbi:MAG: peptide ABC transporter substrate-binding protein [Chloroflexi bacterium]|nr:peptide ABC transporter substrate-binding protein [Chloroflexota bacterium]